jgi:raffinose/stachyose/melibiose transport system permease protein
MRTPWLAARRGARRRSRRRNALRPTWLLLLPALAFYVGIVIYPALRDVFEAFTDWNGIDPVQHFVGLDNFRKLADDPILHTAVRNTIIIAVVVTVMQNGLGLLAALALHNGIKSRGLLRAMLFLPVVVNPIVVAYTWQFIYVTGGPIDKVLGLLQLDSLQQNWLGDPSIVLAAALVPMVWQYIGYSMVIFLAGLEGIPPDIIEASQLDGAGSLTRFRYITWPLLAPALTINAVLTMIGGLNAFTVIFALTGGGPGNATQTVTTVLYQEAFNFGHYGYGTAMACGLSLVVAIVAFGQVKFLRGREFVA